MYFRAIQEGAITKEMPDVEQHSEPNGQGRGGEVDVDTVARDLATELATGAAEFDEEERQRHRAMIDSLPLQAFAADSGDAAWEDAEKQVREAGERGRRSMTIGVKTPKPAAGKSKRKAGEALADAQREAAHSERRDKKPKTRSK